MDAVTAVHLDVDTENQIAFAEPDGLCERGRAAWRAIVATLGASGDLHSGGCRAFYAPREWAERGERYGTESLLVVVYDGGQHRDHFNGSDSLNYGSTQEMSDALAAIGLYHEACTGWYGAVYQI